MKLEVSLSKAGDPKPVKVGKTGKVVLAYTGMGLSPIKIIKDGVEAGALKHDPFSHAVQVQLAKTGVHKSTDLQKALKLFYDKATKTEKEVFLPADELKKLVTALNDKITLARKRRAGYSRVRGRLVRSGVAPTPAHTTAAHKAQFTNVALLYTYVARKLCSVLGAPFKPSIALYMITGKAATAVPLNIKKIFSGATIKGAASAQSDGRTLDQLKASDFKTYNPELMLRLPDLYKEYLKANRPAVKKVPRSSRYSRGYRNYVNPVDARGKSKQKAIESLKAAVGEELFAFYSHVIPALHKVSINDVEKSWAAKRREKTSSPEFKAWQQAERAFRKLGGAMNPRYFTIPKTPKKLEKFKAALKARNEAKKAYKGTARAAKEEKLNAHAEGIKKWMVPYMGQHNDLSRIKGASKSFDPGLLAHRLVTKANSGKLKASDVELKAVIDQNSAVTLTFKGVGAITEAVGSTVKAAKTVFTDCLDIVKPKMFVVGVSDHQGQGLGVRTDLGVVKNQRLLRLNRLTAADGEAVLKQFAKEYQKWNPIKTELDDLAKSLNATPQVKAGKMKAVACSKEQVKVYNDDVKQFMSQLHGVGIKVVEAWDVTPSKKALTALKNLKASGNVKVIRNVFHGCARETGSIILHSGFKISGTQVTGRAMGDVLYIAPCIDKSAQYTGSKGFGRTAGTKGIIFMGDIIIAGSPLSHTNPSRARGGMVRRRLTPPGGGSNVTTIVEKEPVSSNRSLRWTKIGSFKTEEIGLVDPNMQFLIKHAFLIQVTRDVGTKNPLADKMGKFEKPISIKNYSLT